MRNTLLRNVLSGGSIVPMVTPFRDNLDIDWEGLRKLIEFWIVGKARALFVCATLGEAMVLTEKERVALIRTTIELVKGRVPVLAGCGSSSTQEALYRAGVARELDVAGVILVDPPFNQPSSGHIRDNYIRPIADKFQDLAIIPYAIPATSCVLEPPDLAKLAWDFSNVVGVEDATGDLARMAEIRWLAPPNFMIFNGSTSKITAAAGLPVWANGAVSGYSNVCPTAIQLLLDQLAAGESKANETQAAVDPLGNAATVKISR